MKIFVFGNVAAGKTFFVKKIVNSFPELEVLCIDDFRRRMGDGSREMEIKAKKAFLDSILPWKNQIIEAMGLGDTGDALFEKAKSFSERIIVVVLCTDLALCKIRISERVWDVPYPAPPTRAVALAETSDVLLKNPATFLRWKPFADIAMLEHGDSGESFLSMLQKLFNSASKMNQDGLVNRMKRLVFPKCEGVRAALLIGSCANGKMTGKSDVDWSLWVREDTFSKDEMIRLIHENIPGIYKVLWVRLRNKIAVFFKNAPKMEIVINKKIDDIDLLFLGSEIHDGKESVVFAVPDDRERLQAHLNDIIQQKALLGPDKRKSQIVRDLSDKFLFEFENASSMHRRSDSYKFYFNYNIALQVAIQLQHIARKGLEHYYLPKQFARNLSNDAVREFRDLNGSLYLPDANGKKKKLIEYFLDAQQRLRIMTKREISEMRSFLETIYRRDYLFNFRDVAEFNPAIKPRKIFRSSCIARYQYDIEFSEIIKQKGITTIVDLRDFRECTDRPYDSNILKNLSIRRLHIPMRIEKDYDSPVVCRHESPRVMEYQGFAYANKDTFYKFLTEVDPMSDTVLVHCHIGQDRTGVFVALLAMLMGENRNHIEDDYLESGMDADLSCIRAFMDTIEHMGGAEEYIRSCGISAERISRWRLALVNMESA